MKVICEANRGVYHDLTEGKEYELIDIQLGIFDGYYAVVIGDFKKKVVAYSWRFNLTDEQCKKYIQAKQAKDQNHA